MGWVLGLPKTLSPKDKRAMDCGCEPELSEYETCTKRAPTKATDDRALASTSHQYCMQCRSTQNGTTRKSTRPGAATRLLTESGPGIIALRVVSNPPCTTYGFARPAAAAHLRRPTVGIRPLASMSLHVVSTHSGLITKLPALERSAPVEAHCGNEALGIDVFECDAQFVAILPAPRMLTSISLSRLPLFFDPLC